MANKKKSNRKRNNKINSSSQSLSIEVKLAIFIVIITIFTCSNFGLLGIVGRYLSGAFFVLLGIPFYLITVSPILIVLYALTKNSKRHKLIKKYYYLIGIFLTINTLIELFLSNNSVLEDRISTNFNFPHIGGGIIAYFFSNILKYIFSFYGSVIILFITFLFLVLLITDMKPIKKLISYLNALSDPKDKTINKDKSLIKKEEYEEKSNKENIRFDDLDEILNKIDKETIDIMPENKSYENNYQSINNRTEENINKKSIKLSDEKKSDKNEKIIIEPITRVDDNKNDYKFPSIENLTKSNIKKSDDSSSIRQLAITLKQTLDSFGVNAEISDISKGPSVTRFEIVPDIGVKVSKIVGLADDIKLNLAAKDIRIEAPIPGKAAVGIEVPNSDTTMVRFRDLIESNEFNNAKSKLSFCVGLSIEGKPVIADIQKMPHVLIAGATGSGKSVCINTLIMSILFKASPDEVKLIMVDPKVVELSIYNGIPHLLIPVVTDPKRASGALNWAVSEMEKRYKQFAKLGVKDIFGFNEKIKTLETDEYTKLPQILIIIDELADLMMVASNEVEAAICRLAQLARACGIHLVIATQRPSVNVITGLIKANIPSRIAFAVSSGVDSRTILDMNGAEKLLGRGDMLFYPAGIPKPERIQGAFIDENEVAKVVAEISVDEADDDYTNNVQESLVNSTISGANMDSNDDKDEYFEQAARLIVEKQRASIGLLQRLLKIGFNRAARIMDQLFVAGIVGAEEGTKPRKVLVDESELEEILKNGDI